MINHVVFYRDVLVPIVRKEFIIRKVGGRTFHKFINSFGDLPAANMNLTTGKMEEVVNTRGFGYAGRNRLKHRQKAK